MLNEDLRWAIASLKCGWEDRRLYSEYYKGKQELCFSSPNFQAAFVKIFDRFCENLCKTVVDTISEKLVLQGVLPGSSPLEFLNFDESELPNYKPSEPTAKVKLSFEALWKLNRLDALAIQVHKEALKLGNSYVIVWPDVNGFPKLFFNPADLVTVRYSDEQMIDLAAKLWKRVDDGRIRLNLYYSDRVEKFVCGKKEYEKIYETVDQEQAETLLNLSTAGSGFEPWVEDGDPGGIVNHDFGRVPVFHFSNSDDPSGFGVSELEPVVPLQRALNKSIIDMLVGSEYHAFPQRYATGIELSYNPTTGKAEPNFKPGSDRLWFSANPNVKFGEFATINLSSFVQVSDSFRMACSRVSGIPPHYFNFGDGGWPSGEALKSAEVRLSSKTINRQVFFGNTWEDIFSFAGSLLLKENFYCNSQWLDTRPENEKEKAETSKTLKEIGVSAETLQERHGFDPEKEKARNQKAQKEALKLAPPPPQNDQASQDNPENTDPEE